MISRRGNFHELVYSLWNVQCKLLLQNVKGFHSSREIRKISSYKKEIERTNPVSKKMEDVKVSKENSANALFDECFEELYKMKKKIDTESVEYDTSTVIEELNKEELKITKNIFERVNKKKKHVSELSYKDIYIDPYWNPFKEVDDLRREISYEFNEYAKLANIVEIKKERRAIKKSLKEQYKLYNPYSGEYNKHFNININDDNYITCNDKNEKYWNPTFNKKKILNIKAPFTWRHTHLLHHFIGENGLILPRKINYTTRKQQIQVFKSICIARRMALYPYDRKPYADDLIPIMDPMQFLADELTHRYAQHNDLRAKAILKVMVNKYPSLNYHKYFCHEANRQTEHASHTSTLEEDNEDDKKDAKRFARIMQRYKRNYYQNTFSY
ncbi:mitochondrial ribosomal protein S18 precursor, putative [Plasmodium ovale]|nr:mitochondrial ribosomal protein S18 precursor, putative [Plasmodium ovale curtisi]SCP06043.1 mitochondrial ribosomal protein S18 precursor, putative [Plasmodium ovale]